jgi:hypothetical protein
LAEAGDGRLYVVKFTNNLQGPNLPFNESIGSELYRACGLAGPAWKPLQVSESFLDRNPDCWIQTPTGCLRPESGLCFGSEFLGGSGVRLFEILPGTSFPRVRNRQSFWLAWLLDVCALHTDNRQALFLEDAAGQLKAFFIDHGHLFGGPNGGEKMHFLGSRYLDPRIYESVSSQYVLDVQRVAEALDADQLWRRVRDLPGEWKRVSALDAFAQCLDRMSSPDLLQNVVDTIDEAIRNSDKREERERQERRMPPVSVLRPRIQAAGFEPRFVTNRAGRLNCA